MTLRFPRMFQSCGVVILLTSLVSISTSAAQSLVIQLLDPQGSPVGRGLVEVRKDPTDEWPILASHTDEHGLFSRSDCPSNLKALYIKAVACPFEVKTLSAAWPQEKITVVLEAETPLGSACGVRPPSGQASMCVRVRSRECLPLKKSYLTLSNLTNPFTAEANVDENGRASFTNLMPGGAYSLKVTGEPGFNTVVLHFPNLSPGSTVMVDIQPLTEEVSRVAGSAVIDSRTEGSSPIIDHQPDYADSKAALAALRDCANPGERTSCNDYAVSYLEKAYWGGENWILEAVMPLIPHFDGAVAEGASAFLSDVLLRRTKAFLKVLAEQPTEIQGRIAASAAWADGSGLSAEDSQKCIALLTRYQRSPRLKGPATLCKNAVQVMTKESEEWEAQQANPPVPLTGMMVATACRINTITVILGPPGKERPRAVLLGPDTIITGRQGGRYACDLMMGATGEVRIWTAEPWKGWDSLKDDEPIKALVVVLER